MQRYKECMWELSVFWYGPQLSSHFYLYDPIFLLAILKSGQ
jgi:hypothetical protein